MKKLTIGMVAHVDAGKTTLSEALLYHSGSIRKMGRVDKQDAFLDTYSIEKLRGITVFSKEARLEYGDMTVTLMDTPGHVDFSTEMERALQVIDYAVLIINGNEGCQGHTETLWKLLERYNVPVFIFVNKMDMPGAKRDKLMDNLKRMLSGYCIDFTDDSSYDFYENVATSSEELLEQFLENEKIDTKNIKFEIKNRNIFPCFFGSALKDENIDEFLEGLDKYTLKSEYSNDFGAKVFKITRDSQGNRLSHLKITGGSLKTRDLITYQDYSEKINQIRQYNGEKFEAVNEVFAGDICAITGLTYTYAGEGIGMEEDDNAAVLEPVLRYRITLPRDIDAREALPKLKQLQEEDPKLNIQWDEEAKDIYIQLMGDIQLEIIKNQVLERFDMPIGFNMGNIVYKETIKGTVEGVGHYEPLRHYAEVHLLIEEGERGSGVVIGKRCSEDFLARNWQRLILTHLNEREHKGVLVGGNLTDVKITLVSGRAHKKHTEGGDFRQATYRAVRQGLMEAESVLLEPYYDFRMELPTDNVGKAMSDVDKMYGTCEILYDENTDQGYSVLIGSAPVACMRGYQIEFASYTRGFGKLSYTLSGYDVCHNSEEVLENSWYVPEADLYNPVGSVFCEHGSGIIIPWDKVKEYMHLPSVLDNRKTDYEYVPRVRDVKSDISIDEEEIERIMSKTFYSNKSGKKDNRKYHNKSEIARLDKSYSKSRKQKIDNRDKYLLVDGYNIIFSFNELKTLAEINIDSARDKLIDMLSTYNGKNRENIIVVFDAYKIKGGENGIMNIKGINVVFTKYAQTADSYIEKFAHDNNKKYNITVATSDYMEQVIVVGQGCNIISARELEYIIKENINEVRESLDSQRDEKVKIGDMVDMSQFNENL